MRGFRATAARSFLSRSARRSPWAALGIFIAGVFAASGRQRRPRLDRVDLPMETITVKELAQRVQKAYPSYEIAHALAGAVLDFIEREEQQP